MEAATPLANPAKSRADSPALKEEKNEKRKAEKDRRIAEKSKALRGEKKARSPGPARRPGITAMEQAEIKRSAFSGEIKYQSDISFIMGETELSTEEKKKIKRKEAITAPRLFTKPPYQ
ncbi:MAG: hypothetical protein Fur0012_13590 [Elusimicrobiota bacterium]